MKVVGILFFLYLYVTNNITAQFVLSGKITNEKLEPLPFVSVRVRDSHLGVLTNESGDYKLALKKGIYEITISMIGYKAAIHKVFVESNTVQNFILQEADNSLSGVTVKAIGKDRAEEYIKMVIKNKDAIKSAAGAYSCNAYIKSVRLDSFTTKKKLTQVQLDSIAKTFNPQNMSVAEVYSRLDFEPPTKVKEERTGVSRKGTTWSMFYLTVTDGRFNIYENLLKVPSVSAIPFVSPVSYSGLLAYKYKTVQIIKKGNHQIHTISYKPTAVSNATVTGELVIDDSAWVVLSNRFTLPKYHLPRYDFFEVEQKHEFVNNTAWMVTREQFTYYSKTKRDRSTGVTTATYSDFELNKTFPKRYFGTELSAATDSSYNRDSVFWNTVRAEPLSNRELQTIRYRDSIYYYTHSKAYLDSIDAKANRVNWKNILYKEQPLQHHEKGVKYVFPSIATTVVPYIFSFGGLRVGLPFRMEKNNPVNKKTFQLRTDINYGFLNHDVNGYIGITRKYNPFSQATYKIDLSRNFAAIFVGDAWINQISRRNYYLDNSFGGDWSRELLNGLKLKVYARMALRRSLSHYKTYAIVDTLLQDVFDNNQAPDFEPYNAVYGGATLEFTPFQPYIREPRQKIILESKWPTAFVNWQKGVPKVLGSDVNFDYLGLGLKQFLRFGTLGVADYTIKTGSFFNTKSLKLVDYKFQRRGDPYLFMNPQEAFQALDSTFPVFKRFYEGHYFHEFNGAILNKIPIFKKIGLREVAGAGFLIAPEVNLRYGELFTGIERVFKMPFQFLQKVKLGVYVVSSYANTYSNPVQFKIGITSWNSITDRWR
ncbi:MAG: DUF5686 and carboxypeptidase regulatory-like domain-containing protein [Niabella sp.]